LVAAAVARLKLVFFSSSCHLIVFWMVLLLLFPFISFLFRVQNCKQCGWGLVCSGLKNKGDRVDGCDGFVGMDQVQFCMQDPAGRPNDNGAAVESVEVISGGATTGDEDGSDQSEQAVAAAETEEQQEEDSSSARAASILLTSTGVASLVVAVGFF